MELEVLLYEGKAKKLFKTNEEDVLRVLIWTKQLR